MNEKLICPGCGKAYADGAMRFCPFCGAQLFAAAPEMPEPVRAVRARYDAYAAWVESALSDQEIGRVFTAMFTGNRAFKNSPEHIRFLEDVQKLGDTLTADFRAGVRREALPELLRYVLVDCHTDAPRETDWMFLAAEKAFQPLLGLLSAEEAAALYPDYQCLRKKEPGLEIQRKIRKQLKQASKS